jgi:putative salt-induced outer membrane protein YdiY
MAARLFGFILALVLIAPAFAADEELSFPGPDLFRLPDITPEEIVAPAAKAPNLAGEELPSPSDKPPEADEENPLERSHGWVPGVDVLEPKYWDPWEGNVELGLSGTEGNSQTFNVRLGMTAKHKTDWLVKTMQLTSIQKTANGETTANTALLDGRLDWPLPQSRWNYFLHSLIEYDEFKAFDVRLSADTGFGFEFVQTDFTTLIGRTGFALSHEIGGPDDDITPEWLFGAEYKHKFNEFHSFSFKTDFYPALADFADFRLNSQASWEMMLSKDWGLSLKLSAIDRYDSTPFGAKPNDLDYSTLLLWNF